MGFAEIGKRRPRVDAIDQVSGRVQFTADIYLPGMLYAKGLFSSEYHARILDVDTSKAERLPGVRAIITAKDVPYNKFGIEVEESARSCGKKSEV